MQAEAFKLLFFVVTQPRYGKYTLINRLPSRVLRELLVKTSSRKIY